MRSFWNSSLTSIVSLCLTSVYFSCHALAETKQTPGSAEVAEAAPAAKDEVEAQSARSIVALRTERYPLATNIKGTYQSRMVREIVRQAILLAAREELGLATRDETLGEPMPSPEVQPLGILDLKVRAYYDGRYEITLVIGADQENGEEGTKVWSHIGTIPTERNEIYLGMTQEMISHLPAIVAALREAGFVASSESQAEAEQILPEVEELLKQTNFVSQYAAVRAAHRAIEGSKLSPQRLGILVRGYAHLSALTTHLWSSHTEALAARSLLYAERMRSCPEGDMIADQHLAYGMGLIGMHSTALAMLDSLEEGAEAVGEEEIEASPEEERKSDEGGSLVGPSPEWSQLVRPYCEFKHDELREIAKQNPEFNELVTFLLWEQYRAYQHGRWMYEKGMQTMEVCPEAYSVYAALAQWNALRVERIGAYSAMRVFGSQLASRVLSLSGLPEAARKIDNGSGSIWAKLFGGGNEDNEADSYSRVPVKIAKALVKQTENTSAEVDLSWAVLGNLIVEEQFTQVANLMRVSDHGVDHSNAQLVQTVLPLIKGHRYENYIRTFALQNVEKEEYWEVLDGMKVEDPRGNMHRMFRRLWSYRSTPDTEKGSELSWMALFKPTSTLAGCIESAYTTGNYWRNKKDREEWELISFYFKDVSPHSPKAFVLGMRYKNKIDMDDLEGWEAEAGEDPVAWLFLGDKYYRRWETDAAIRCFKRSLEISPSFNATDGLANAYRRAGQEELWAPTLKTYLQYEDLSLSHAHIHNRIADYFLEKRQWEDALPHAEAAAQTWSAWGLLLASKVYEGLQDWEKSEYMASEASQHYPSHSHGVKWYFWCRRTGRGDLDAALENAKKWLSIQRESNSETYNVAVYRLLEDDPQEALRIFQKLDHECNAAKEPYDKARYLAHIALIARIVGEDDLSEKSVNRLRQVALGPVKKKNEKLAPIVLGFCDILQGEAVDAQALESIRANLKEVEVHHQCNYNYFLGAALEERAKIDEAISFWRPAAFYGPFDYANSTLAGDRLVLEYGPLRGGPIEEVDSDELESNAESDQK